MDLLFERQSNITLNAALDEARGQCSIYLGQLKDAVDAQRELENRLLLSNEALEAVRNQKEMEDTTKEKEQNIKKEDGKVMKLQEAFEQERINKSLILEELDESVKENQELQCKVAKMQEVIEEEKEKCAKLKRDLERVNLKNEELEKDSKAMHLDLLKEKDI